jgi:ribosomal protein L4
MKVDLTKEEIEKLLDVLDENGYLDTGDIVGKLQLGLAENAEEEKQTIDERLNDLEMSSRNYKKQLEMHDRWLNQLHSWARRL